MSVIRKAKPWLEYKRKAPIVEEPPGATLTRDDVDWQRVAAFFAG
jgi:hypothetical protein